DEGADVHAPRADRMHADVASSKVVELDRAPNARDAAEVRLEAEQAARTAPRRRRGEQEPEDRLAPVGREQEAAGQAELATRSPLRADDPHRAPFVEERPAPL